MLLCNLLNLILIYRNLGEKRSHSDQPILWLNLVIILDLNVQNKREHIFFGTVGWLCPQNGHQVQKCNLSPSLCLVQWSWSGIYNCLIRIFYFWENGLDHLFFVWIKCFDDIATSVWSTQLFSRTLCSASPIILMVQINEH